MWVVRSRVLDQIADTLCDDHTIGRLTQLCDRWAYSSCLCFALDLDEQSRSQFRYRYSVYQIEYSRNLLFTRGTVLDTVYQGLIERTRQYHGCAETVHYFWLQKPSA